MRCDFKAWLIKSEVLTPGEVEAYTDLANQKNQPLWEVLLAENKITEAFLADMYARRLRIPLVSLSTYPIDSEAAHRIPEKLARQYLSIPVACRGRVLDVAMVDPTNLDAIQAIEFFTGCSVQPCVVPRTEVLEAIETNFARSQAVDFIAEASESPDFQILSTAQDLDLDENASLRASEIPPIIKLVNLVITEALRLRASDIHLEPTQRDLRTRLRVDGVLRDFLQAPAWLHAGLTTRLKVLSKLDIAEKRVPQDGRFKVRFQNRVADVRVSTLPTQFGEKVVMRLLGSSDSIPDLNQLGLPTDAVEAVVEAVMQPQGMVIVTGPTGSGKTTALYSFLCRRRSSEVSIVTVEDPIEYQLEGANQVQVNVKSGLTFAGCLRSILRQDPDVILVGEIRDRETAEIAFHASMTGHLVLTTLHTNSSVATVLRLLELGVDPFVLSSTVTLIMAQRLARRICDHCREVYVPPAQVLDKLNWDDREFTFTRGRGCKDCRTTGFQGRIGIFELLKMTAAVRAVISSKGSEGEIRKAALASGFTPLLFDARNKIRSGITTPEEVLRVIQWNDAAEARCDRCARPIPAEMGKCLYCADLTGLRCQACGQELSPDWRVCPRCGTGISQEGSQSRPPQGLEEGISVRDSGQGRKNKGSGVVH